MLLAPVARQAVVQVSFPLEVLVEAELALVVPVQVSFPLEEVEAELAPVAEVVQPQQAVGRWIGAA